MSGNGTVVIVEGYVDDSRSPWWSHAKSEIERIGYNVEETSSDSFLENSKSPRRQAEYLSDTVDSLPDTQEIALFCYSMGGLTGRYLLEEQGYDEQIDKIVTVGTKHQSHDLRHGADLFEDLNTDLSDNTDYLNIYSANDLMVKGGGKLPENRSNTEEYEVGKNVFEAFVDDAGNLSRMGRMFANQAADTAKESYDLSNPFSAMTTVSSLMNDSVRNMSYFQNYLINSAEEKCRLTKTGHFTIMFNDTVWSKVEDFLEN